MSPLTPMDDQARFEMERAASLAERRHRPVHLVVLTGVLMLIGLIMVGMAFRSRGAAERALAYEASEARQILAAARSLKEARALDDSGEGGAEEPRTRIRSQIEDLARQAGIDNVQPPSSPRSERSEGAVRFDYPYEVQDPSIRSVMQWLEAVTRDVSGMFVREIRVRPETQRKVWRVEVVLSLWITE